MHLPPEVWGPLFWCTLHIISLGYPNDPTFAEKRAAKEHFNSLMYLLPCPMCRSHFREILQVSPIDSWLDNRNSLVEWVWYLHNQVNIRLNKPTITQAEFFMRYTEMATRGLPVPPSKPIHEITATAEEAAWIRGASTVAGVVAASAAVGALLWVSYSK
jgi:hypothetical protein